LELKDCYAVPNPFNPDAGQTTMIHYTLNQDAQVTIEIMQAGALIKSFGPYAPGSPESHAGQNMVEWDGYVQSSDTTLGSQFQCLIKAEKSGQSRQQVVEIVRQTGP
jgi:hypothetical protein